MGKEQAKIYGPDLYILSGAAGNRTWVSGWEAGEGQLHAMAYGGNPLYLAPGPQQPCRRCTVAAHLIDQAGSALHGVVFAVETGSRETDGVVRLREVPVLASHSQKRTGWFRRARTNDTRVRHRHRLDGVVLYSRTVHRSSAQCVPNRLGRCLAGLTVRRCECRAIRPVILDRMRRSSSASSAPSHSESDRPDPLVMSSSSNRSRIVSAAMSTAVEIGSDSE
jgi:hypothetical protein